MLILQNNSSKELEKKIKKKIMGLQILNCLFKFVFFFKTVIVIFITLYAATFIEAAFRSSWKKKLGRIRQPVSFGSSSVHCAYKKKKKKKNSNQSLSLFLRIFLLVLCEKNSRSVSAFFTAFFSLVKNIREKKK